MNEKLFDVVILWKLNFLITPIISKKHIITHFKLIST